MKSKAKPQPKEQNYKAPKKNVTKAELTIIAVKDRSFSLLFKVSQRLLFMLYDIGDKKEIGMYFRRMHCISCNFIPQPLENESPSNNRHGVTTISSVDGIDGDGLQ
jgi:hypothetical protein